MSNSPQLEPWEKLHRYWLSKHVDGQPPARNDLDPIVEIPQLVANLIILEMDGDGYIYRLAGSEVVAQAGFDMTGLRVGSSGVHAKAMPHWLEALDFVRTNQVPRLMVSHFVRQTVAKNIVLVLPLHAPPPMLLIGSFYRGHYEPGMKIEGVSILESLGPLD